MKKYMIVFLMLTLVGCGTIKDQTGEFVTEAVVDHLTTKIDDLLEKRGLSVQELKNAFDENGNSTIEKEEILDNAKETAKDVALLEAKKLVDAQIEANSKKMANADDLTKQKYEILNWILGLIAAYLGKQIYSAKQDGKRDQKIAVVEKLLNRDIDGDGKIGNGASSVNVNGNGNHSSNSA